MLARRLTVEGGDAVEQLTIWALRADWGQAPSFPDHLFGGQLDELARGLMSHFKEGVPAEPVVAMLDELRRLAYARGTSETSCLRRWVLAVVKLRLAGSAWTLLPGFSGLDSGAWAEAIRRPGFPKELWPSQKFFGRAGLFSGRSGVVQMPTSARGRRVPSKSFFGARSWLTEHG